MKKLLFLSFFLNLILNSQEAPSSFMLINEKTGELVLFKDYFKKKPMIINFWASYCIPCKKEMPEIQEIAKESNNVELIFINIDSSKEKTAVKSFLAETNIKETVLLDIYQVAAKSYLPSLEVPATFLIGSDGLIKYKTIGYSEKTIKELKVRVPKLK
jgi:thiol-disulfide isomerase/thioredoxin